ncbi:histidine phosphatase family protein [Micromonospora kangleipakensis]|uniref:histidine phosphatase family protein n=1 Tax=Micromonospora kangleipakensis TaxID=1077942 RepID=UPI001F5F3E8A|nr:histidine phosphatase family protein [Micromonospora kangleipakensis]
MDRCAGPPRPPSWSPQRCRAYPCTPRRWSGTTCRTTRTRPACPRRTRASWPASTSASGRTGRAGRRRPWPGSRRPRPTGDVRELVITHNFLIAWFVRHALDAPERRWLGLNHHNCGLTVIRYSSGGPPNLIAVNDVAHLPPELRGTGLPPDYVV